jgi:D-alanyl-D-alanine carboxypeptidase (penicillin-binding protein 5/6)
MRKLLAGLTLVAAAVSAAPLPAADNPYPDLAAAYLVQVEGRTLWANATTRRLPPASLTKIMTALLVLERGGLDETTTISAHAAAATGSRLKVRAGERFKVEDLLVATLVGSANDACRALAEWHSGSESEFVAAMNRKVRALRLANTHFANACGFDAKGHYSSARDLARLAETAMANARFRGIVALREADLQDADGRSFRVATTNALLGRLPGAIGIKSGHTRRAGRCIIVLAQRGSRHVLLVMLGAANRWWDAHDIVERAFAAAAH